METNSQDPQADTGLDHFLSQPQPNVMELLQASNILTEIRLDFTRFVQYLTTRKTVLKKLMDVALETSQKDMEANQALKKCCLTALQILSNDEDCLLNLYFQPAEEDIKEEINEADDFDKLLTTQKVAISDGGDRPEEGEILAYLLSKLQQPNPNQALPGYIAKLLASVIRNSGKNFLSFLTKRPDTAKLLLNSLRSPSIGSIIVRILTVDDEQKKYPFRKLKKELVEEIGHTYLLNLNDTELEESICLLIEDAFQSMRNKFFEFPEDFVDSFNQLVTSEYIEKLTSRLLDGQPAEIESICSILLLFVKKLNNQIDEFQQNLKERREQKQMTNDDFILKFQIDALFQGFDQLLDELGPDKTCGQASSYTKYRFIELLLQLAKNQTMYQKQLPFGTIIAKLIELLSKTHDSGLYRNSIFELCRMIMEKKPGEATKQLKFEDEKWIRTTFPISVQNQTNVHEINMDARLSHELHLLVILSTIDPTIRQNLLKNNIDILAVKDRYNQPLGEEAKKPKDFIDDDELQEKAIFSRVGQSEMGTGVIRVGPKKNITILNLRYMANIKHKDPATEDIIVVKQKEQIDKELEIKIEDDTIEDDGVILQRVVVEQKKEAPTEPMEIEEVEATIPVSTTVYPQVVSQGLIDFYCPHFAIL